MSRPPNRAATNTGSVIKNDMCPNTPPSIGIGAASGGLISQAAIFRNPRYVKGKGESIQAFTNRMRGPINAIKSHNQIMKEFNFNTSFDGLEETIEKDYVKKSDVKPTFQNTGQVHETYNVAYINQQMNNRECNLTNVTYIRAATNNTNSKIIYKQKNGHAYTQDAQHLLDLNGIDYSFNNKDGFTPRVNVNDNKLKFYDMTMVDYEDNSIASQTSLRASNNDINKYSLKTIKAGKNITITPSGENAQHLNCLVIDATSSSTISDITNLQTTLNSKLSVSNIKNYDNPGSFNTNGDFTTHNLVLESYGTNINTINMMGVNTGANTNTNITGWVISRSAAADDRNVWYSANGMTPALTKAAHRPAVTTPTSKPSLSLKGSQIVTSFSNLTDGETYTVKFYASHYHYSANNTGNAGGKLVAKIKQSGYSDITIFDDYPTRMASNTNTAPYFQHIQQSFTASGTGTYTELVFYYVDRGSDNRNMFIADVQVVSSTPPQQTDGEGLFAVSSNQLNLKRIKGGQNITASSDNYGVLTIDSDVTFPSSYIAQTGSVEGQGLLSIGNTNAKAAADRAGGAKTKNSIFIGQFAGDGVDTINDNYGGDNVTAVGHNAMGALENNVHMSDTTAIGASAGYQTRSINSTMVGYQAGYKTRNNASVFVGNGAGKDTLHTTGQNIGIGHAACQGQNQLSQTMIGYQAGSGGGNNKGQQNTMIGHNSGQGWRDDTHSGRNIFIGSQSGRGSYAKRCIYIGVATGKDQGSSAAHVDADFQIGTLLQGTLPSYQGGSEAGVFKINAGHLEIDAASVPTAYDSTWPNPANRIWLDDGVLRVGPKP